MAKKTETPFDKLMTTRTTLGLYLQYGDAALDGKPLANLLTDVAECFEDLMTFRNIINGMVGFDEKPEEAVLPYLSNATVAKLAA